MLKIEYKKISDNPLWRQGKITLGDYVFSFEAKIFDEPSQFGINEGCISKLFVKQQGSRDYIISYDRGWDKKPRTELGKILLSIITTEFDD